MAGQKSACASCRSRHARRFLCFVRDAYNRLMPVSYARRMRKCALARKLAASHRRTAFFPVHAGRARCLQRISALFEFSRRVGKDHAWVTCHAYDCVLCRTIPSSQGDKSACDNRAVPLMRRCALGNPSVQHRAPCGAAHDAARYYAVWHSHKFFKQGALPLTAYGLSPGYLGEDDAQESTKAIDQAGRSC